MKETRWNPTPPGWTPSKTATPKPRILLFEFEHTGNHYCCELLDHGDLGTEAQFSKNGELLEGRTFGSAMLAVLWADKRRKAIESD